MPKVKALTPAEARHTLAHRLGPRVDRIRQIATKLGIRPYRIFLTWEKWTGKERGEGDMKLVERMEILPTPKVEDLASVSFSLFAIGTFPVGTLRVSRISVASFTYDMLTGHWVPKNHEDKIPEPYSFFYEVVEDGRGDDPAVRARYRLLGTPWRHAGGVHWKLLLERISPDLGRDGLPKEDDC